MIQRTARILEAKHAAMIEERANWKIQESDLKASIERLTEEVAAKSAELSSLGKHSLNADASIQCLKEKIASLENTELELEEARINIEAKEEEIASLKTCLAQQQELQIASFVSNLTKEAAASAARQVEANQVNLMSDSIAAKQKELDGLKSEITRLSSQNEELQAMVEELNQGQFDTEILIKHTASERDELSMQVEERSRQ